MNAIIIYLDLSVCQAASEELCSDYRIQSSPASWKEAETLKG